jgi:hypothetical protein
MPVMVPVMVVVMPVMVGASRRRLRRFLCQRLAGDQL